MYLNRITLIGYLARDAEPSNQAASNPHTVLIVVTKTSWKDRTGQWQSRSELHRCVGWGIKFAEFAKHLRKGAHVQIEGELRSRDCGSPESTHRAWEVHIRSVLKLEKAWRVLETVSPGDQSANAELE